MAKNDEQERLEIRKDFAEVVNMAPQALERWLSTRESREVGWGKDDGGESVGHESGRRIVDIRRKRLEELDADDYAHMKKVIGTSGAISRRAAPTRTSSTPAGAIRSRTGGTTPSRAEREPSRHRWEAGGR